MADLGRREQRDLAIGELVAFLRATLTGHPAGSSTLGAERGHASNRRRTA